MASERNDLASRIAAGLAGWLQELVAQNLAGLHGEDAARFQIAQIVSAQAQWKVATSQRPPNWPDTAKSRMDLALLPWKADAKVWYGAIEVKWPGEAVDVGAEREKIIQDVIRLASAETSNLNATFLVLGGTSASLAAIFDKAHPRADNLEQQRVKLGVLLPRTLGAKGTLSLDDLQQHFPEFLSRIPGSDLLKNPPETTLLAVEHARMTNVEYGSIYVWQCDQKRGAPKKTASGQ